MAQFLDKVQASLDDGYWAGSWITNSSQGIGKNFFGNTVYSAWRWINVSVPQGATINSAYLRIVADETKSDNILFTLKGIDEDNTANFSSDPNSRPKTTAGVNWQINGQVAGSTYTSPDIKSIIQEIVDRAGWGSGGALGIITQDNGTANDTIGRFKAYDTSTTLCGELEINYQDPVGQVVITKSLSYRVTTTPNPQKMLRYSIKDMELDPQPFSGIKVAKAGHNAVNAKLVESYKFHSDYNTLKYFLNGTSQLHVINPPKNEYNVVGYIDHNLGYFPFAIVYAKDDLMANYQPLGRYQAGSGAYRQFYYYLTITRLYFVVTGWSESGNDDYYVDFYYKIFRNDLGL